MLIRYHGHSEFLIEGAGGLRILTDPFDPRIPFPQKRVKVDIVTISHEHLDHCYTDKLLGEPRQVRGPGAHEPAEGLRILGVDSFHDDARGSKRGHNTIFILSLEGLRLAHLGDLGSAHGFHIIFRFSKGLYGYQGWAYSLGKSRGCGHSRYPSPGRWERFH